MPDVEKPRRKPGTVCPFFRQDVSEVCHTCELYEALPVVVPASREQFPRWGCTYLHQTFILRDVVSEINALQGKQAEFNDRVWRESQQNVESLIDIARATEQQHGRSLAELVRIASNIERIGPTLNTKLIEGKS